MAMIVKYDISFYARYHTSFPLFFEVSGFYFYCGKIEFSVLFILTSRRRVKSKMTQKRKLQVFYIKHRAGAIK